MLRVVTYAVDGWGVGELALVDDRPVSHELPLPDAAPGARPRRGSLRARPAACPTPLVRLLALIRRFFRGRARQLDRERSPARRERRGVGAHAVHAARRLRARRGAVRRDGQLRRARRRARAGLRAARAAGAFCGAQPARAASSPATASIAADGSLGRLRQLRRRVQAAPARARGRAPDADALAARASSASAAAPACRFLLRGLKLVARDLTAIVTLTDDGGSSGRLRRELEMPPPGDIRACLVALAEDENFMGELFQHRFTRGELAGHSFGNLFLAALTEVAGSFDAAVAMTGRVLAIEGTVVPATSHPAALVAEMDDGRVVAGETAVASDRHGVRRLFLDPARRDREPARDRGDRGRRPDRARSRTRSSPRRCRRCSCPRCGARSCSARARARVRLQPAPAAGRDDRLPASHHLERLHQHVGPACGRHRARPVEPVVADPLIPVDFDRGRLRRARRRGRAPADRRRPPSRPGGARARARCVLAAPRRATAVPFGEDVRAELARDAAGGAALPAGAARRRAARTPGRLHLLAGRGEVHVDCDLASAPSRATVELLRESGASCEIRTYHERRFGRRDALPGDRRRRPALAAGAGRGRRARPRRSRRPSACRARVVARSCCRRTYLRGAFIASGSLSDPSAGAPRVASSSPESAAGAARAGRRGGVPAGRARRRRALRSPTPSAARRSATCSSRSARTARSCGSRRPRVFAWAREQANRLANADAGNLRRQARRRRTAGRDRRARRRRRAAARPARVAELRVAHPEATLAELAELAARR